MADSSQLDNRSGYARLTRWRRERQRAARTLRQLRESGWNPFLELRREMGVFQDWLAVELGVSKHYLCCLERGRRQPSSALLLRLLEVYEQWLREISPR